MKRVKIALFLMTLIVLSYEFLSLDGIAGIVFPIAFPDSTIYSARWNYWGYRRVRKGMSMSDVMELLGPPIQQWNNEVENDKIETRFAYTRSSTDSHFRVRQIVFRDGKVVGKFHEYYVD